MKIIDQKKMETSDKKDEVKDLKALFKIENQCSNFIKFYGAIQAEVY